MKTLLDVVSELCSNSLLSFHFQAVLLHVSSLLLTLLFLAFFAFPNLIPQDVISGSGTQGLDKNSKGVLLLGILHGFFSKPFRA